MSNSKYGGVAYHNLYDYLILSAILWYNLKKQSMKMFRKIILLIILFTIPLPTIFVSNKFGFSNRVIQTANAQVPSVCGDGVISDKEKCDTDGNIGCANPNEPFCNGRCTFCVCSESRLVFLDKPIICTVQDLILFLLSIIGSIALLMLVFSGILYIFAGGNLDAQSKAKRTFNYAIIGLIFVLISYAIIKIITDVSV